MRFRRSASLVTGAAALLTTTTVATAPAAHALGFVLSNTSAGNGWGTAVVYDEYDELYVCDGGNPDGLQAVAYLEAPGYPTMSVTDSDGANDVCSQRSPISHLPDGVSYTLTACLQEGAGGPALHCRSYNGEIYDG